MMLLKFVFCLKELLETATLARPDLVLNRWTGNGAVKLGNIICRNMTLLGGDDAMLVYSSICIDLVVTNFISKMFWGRERMEKKVRGRVGENMIMGCSLYSSIDSYNPIVFSLTLLQWLLP